MIDFKKHLLRHVPDVFPADQVYLILDFETYSEADLKKVGAYEYANHPTTEILCAAFAIGTRVTLPRAEVKPWVPTIPSPNFGDLMLALLDPSIVIVAHNALFDNSILMYCFATKYMRSKKSQIQAIPFTRWICTMSLALAMALPRSLENAVDALNLARRKNKDGSRLVAKFCKPRKASKNNPAVRHDTTGEDFQRLVDYCCDDIHATIGLFLTVNPLSPFERRVWCLDQTINNRGFQVDRPLVDTIGKMLKIEKKNLDERANRITKGRVTSATQNAKVLAYLERKGVYLPNMQKKTIEDALAEGLVKDRAKKLLEIRQSISKVSNAKYKVYEERSRVDGRLRNILVYHVATTGRFGGAGIQPQNLPRPTIKNTLQAAAIVAKGDVELIRMIYGDVMETFSSCIRNMIIATPGYILDVADYSAIEVRVIFWLAGEEKGLKAFREKRDLYKERAATIFGVTADQVMDGSFERFLGKETELGCQYGMGWKKFQESCFKKGQVVSNQLSEKSVNAYRHDRVKVVQMWRNLEQAAINAIQNPSRSFTTNKLTYFMRNNFLCCMLPSGRILSYATPSVEYETDKWGRQKPGIYYWGFDSLKRKWTKIKIWGGTLANHGTQGTARDLMVAAMLRIENTQVWRSVLTVHDEILSERSLMSEGTLEEFIYLMEKVPKWAKGCPIKVEGFSSLRYRK